MNADKTANFAAERASLRKQLQTAMTALEQKDHAVLR